MQVMLKGKRALDTAMLDIGRLVAETLMYMEREEKFVPRLPHTAAGRTHGDERRQGFWCDAELGVPPSGRGDGEAAEAVPGAQSRRLLALRDVPRHGPPRRSGVRGRARRGPLKGKSSLWASGKEQRRTTRSARNCWEGLERRGLKLSKRVLWVTDGGGGIIKALKDRYGKKLIHQRCTLHKDRNIQRHLPKRYRKQAHHLFATALEQNSYKDAKKMLQEFERWLRDINESAANSLVESLEEVLMLHKLKVPALLRKSLHSTNPIESMFSMVRSCERNIKRYRSSKMRQRWLAAVLLHCEQQFKRVKGHASIDEVVAAIDAIHREDEMPEAA